MARTQIATVQLSSDAGVAKGSGTSADATNGMYVADPGPYKLVLEVTNSGATGSVIVRAGTASSISDTVFSRQTLGDLTVSVGGTSTSLIVLDDTDRFVQADGTLNVDFSASFSGTVYGLVRPRNTV